MAKYAFSLHRALRGLIPHVLIVCTLLLNGCISLGGGNKPASQANRPTRSQLVMLNLDEASGWVAYTGNGQSGTETENYRMLVIRQRNGEIIYDSTVPLSSHLETHGFEMEQNDPRFRSLGLNVDSNIIAPMEAYRRRLQEVEAAETPVADNRMPEPPPLATPTPAPTPVPTAQPTPEPTPVAVDTAESPDVPTLIEGPPSSITGIEVLKSTADELTLRLTPADLLNVGDHLFLRNPPGRIAIPGMDDVITAGEVAGWVEIMSIDENEAKAVLKSGKIPDNMYFEKSETP